MKCLPVGRTSFVRGVVATASVLLATVLPAATVEPRYYAHEAVHDEHGVIAPWYRGQNGQCDLRVRVAAETLKRYPWASAEQAATPAPHYVFNGHWQITADGQITPMPLEDWNNGDLGQRAAYVLLALADYYRYSGDAAAIAHMSYQADYLVDHCQTGPDHPWPDFLISVPVKGKAYRQCHPEGMIQLDIVAEAGLGMLAAYRLTENRRYLEAASHWADLLAERRDPTPGAAPWGRYANPEAAPWKDNKQTGGVAFLLYFFEDLIRLGYTGKEGSLVAARDAGRAWLRDTLLPQWTVNDTWGRNYWDWADPVQAENVTEFVARYMIDNPDYFPGWRQDVRNVLSLFINRTSVSPKSNGDVYSGAWAFPESCGCCGRSLWYGPMELAVPFAQYAVACDDDWSREIARRIQILATYDVHESGVSEDNIDGGAIVCGAWFKIAHPMALRHVLGTMAWLPEEFGAARENHIMRSSSTVSRVRYGKGKVEYETFDAPAPMVDVLRLAFVPRSVTADGQSLAERDALDGVGYRVKPLACGDAIVWIRHDERRAIVVEGDDPQQEIGRQAIVLQGDWRRQKTADDDPSPRDVAATAGATMEFPFHGNQVRLIGDFSPDGGLADVFVDGVKQLVGIDCYNPSPRSSQTLYYLNGLKQGSHALKVVVRGEKNPIAQGSAVRIARAFSSAATGTNGFGAGSGPRGPQRMVFGYPGREDYVDSAGNAWRPATEVVTRSEHMADSVALAWWTTPRAEAIEGTADAALYRHGVHAPEFWTNITVAPGAYRVRLLFAETRHDLEPARRAVTVSINGREVEREVDIAARAGGMDRALDLTFEHIEPNHGVIEIRFSNRAGGEAICQAVEVVPER